MHLKNLFAKTAFTFLGFLFIQLINGQENFIPGYIIQINGDTLHGFIDYRNWNKNPSKISYRGKVSDDNHNFKSIDIKEFSVADEIYRSAIVELEITSNKTDQLAFDKEPKILMDTVFLQTLIRGKRSLYIYKSEDGRDLFYIGQDSTVELLVYKKYLKQFLSQTVIAENTKYLGQLAVYLQDCAEIQKELEHLDYRKKDLEKLFLLYYSSSQTVIEFHKVKEKIEPHFGVLAGLSLANFKYSKESDFQKSANFTTGLSLELIFPRNQRKWSFYNELMYTSFLINESYYSQFYNENVYTLNTFSIGYSFLKLNTMLRFKYPISKVYITFSGGISYGYAFEQINEMTIITRYNGPENIRENRATEKIKYEQVYLAGIGAKYKNYAFEIRFENASELHQYNYYVATVNRLSFLLSYRF